MTAAKKIETAAAETEQTAKAQLDRVAKSFDDVATFGRDNVDALVRSQNIAVKAAEEINAEVIAFSKKNFEEGVAHAKDLAGSQSATEFFEKQTGFAKFALESMMQQATRMNDLVAAAARDSIEPINQRVGAAASMAKSYSA